MGTLYKSVALLIPILLGYLYFKITRTDPVPVLEDEYWGHHSEKFRKEDTSIKQFKINISDHTLEDLKTRLNIELNSSRLQEPLEGIGFEYGFNSKYMTSVVGPYWRDSYNWKEREKIFNQWSQFTTNVGGVNIHFYHIKPIKDKHSRKETRAVLMLPGFPGSFVEVFKLIPYLQAKNSKYNFELVIASLPGYGFSSSAAKPGLGSASIANLFKRLMERLGHQKYFVVGRDAGAIAAADMSALFPDRVLGGHSSICWVFSPHSQLRRLIAHYIPSIFLTPQERVTYSKLFNGFPELFAFTIREIGYYTFQTTKPDTLGISLSQSPLGLAAYILEKFAIWTNRQGITKEDGGLTETFTLDELLDNVMIYWLTNSITSAMRFYKESFRLDRKANIDRVPIHVPFACQIFADDMVVGVMPEFAAKVRYRNLQRYTIEPEGGHFAAMENPEVVAKDIITFFNTL